MINNEKEHINFQNRELIVQLRTCENANAYLSVRINSIEFNSQFG